MLHPEALPSDCVRLFVGQTPYDMHSEWLAWLLRQLSKRQVLRVERIVRWTNQQRSCGCFHVYVHEADAPALLALHDSHVLCDTTGAWIATTDTERDTLMRHSKTRTSTFAPRQALRAPQRLMTVEVANSAPKFCRWYY